MILAGLLLLLFLVGFAGGLWVHRQRPFTDQLSHEYTWRYELDEPEGRVWPEPWRHHRAADRCLVLPTEAVWLTAAEDELLEDERREAEYLDDLEQQIDARGIEQPLTIVVDSSGGIKLKDGNHRIICCKRLGVPRVPVLFVDSTGIRRRGTNLQGVLEQMLTLCVESAQPIRQ